MRISKEERKRRKAMRQELVIWAVSLSVPASMYIACEFGVSDGRMLIIPTAYILGAIVLLLCGGLRG